MLFTGDVITFTYFIVMAKNFIKIMNNFYELKSGFFSFLMYSYTIWILITLFRFAILFNVVSIVYAVNGNDEFLEKTLFGLPNRVMIYMN